MQEALLRVTRAIPTQARRTRATHTRAWQAVTFHTDTHVLRTRSLLSPYAPTPVGFLIYPFQLDTSSATFTPRTSEIGRLQETLTIAEEVTRFNPFRDPSDISGFNTPQQSKSSYISTIIFYKNVGDNVFTKERLDVIKSVCLPAAGSSAGGHARAASTRCPSGCCRSPPLTLPAPLSRPACFLFSSSPAMPGGGRYHRS